MRRTVDRGGFALFIALIAVIIATALMLGSSLRVRTDSSLARSGTLRRMATSAAESAVWTTLRTTSAATTRLDPIGTVRKSTIYIDGVTTTVMMTRTDTTHVWIVADAYVRRGVEWARHRAAASALLPADSMSTGLVPMPERAWVESF